MTQPARAFAEPQPVVLVLPYPISANRYWNSFPLGKRIMTAPSKEAKVYKQSVEYIVRAAGIRKPILGRVHLDLALYPRRPLDWAKRAQKDPAGWADTVQCIDLDNARKCLYDALKNLVFEDDKWVWSDSARRMEPDGEPRVIVTVTPLVTDSVQGRLL